MNQLSWVIITQLLHWLIVELIKVYTRISLETSSDTDLIVMSDQENISQCGVIDCFFSDPEVIFTPGLSHKHVKVTKTLLNLDFWGFMIKNVFNSVWLVVTGTVF